MSEVVELLERTIPRTVALVYSTYLGGSGEDGGSGIAVDTADNAYVTGVTFGSGFPGTASRSIQSTFGGGYYDDQSYDAFVAMITTHAKYCVNFLGDPSRKTGQAVMEWERGQAGLERDILAAGMRSYSK